MSLSVLPMVAGTVPTVIFVASYLPMLWRGFAQTVGPKLVQHETISCSSTWE